MTDETNTATSDKIQPRLPRLGCFLIFVIFFFFSIGFATALYHSIFARPVHLAIPEQKVEVSDPENVVDEENRNEIEKLAQEIAKAAQCGVAVMFTDERNESLRDLSNIIVSEWAPGKGVLLLCGVRHGGVCLRLTGDGWQLADWNENSEVSDEQMRYSSRQRGQAALALLKRLKFSIDAAAGMGEKDVTESRTPVLYGSGMGSSEGSAAVWALCFAGIALLIGFFALKNAGKIRERNLRENPRTEEKFRERVKKKSCLKLVDVNKEKTGWSHAPALKIAAIVLGILFGFGMVHSVMTEKIEPDRKFSFGANLPKVLPGRVVDNADVFSDKERRWLAGIIEQAEKSTGGEIVVLTVQSTDGESIESFSLNIASTWKIGKAGKDNGALLVLAIKDRRNRLEIGYGWEGPINDAKAGDMLRAIVPELRAGKYAAAAAKVVRTIEQAVIASGEGVSGAVSDEASADIPPEGTTEQKTARKRVVSSYPNAEVKPPSHDPRKTNHADNIWAVLGILGTLAGILMTYWGRVIMSSVPCLVIIDPTAVRVSSGGSGSSSSSSWGGGSSHSSGGGGGSFGGGGASGRW